MVDSQTEQTEQGSLARSIRLLPALDGKKGQGILGRT
jgi:hypothetical protein